MTNYKTITTAIVGIVSGVAGICALFGVVIPGEMQDTVVKVAGSLVAIAVMLSQLFNATKGNRIMAEVKKLNGGK